MHAAPYPEVPPEFGHWLAGFIDGEGCFSIRLTNNEWRRPVCRFAIALRADDAPIIEEIAAHFGGGYIYQHDPRGRWGRGGAKPKIIWEISSRADCRRLVDLLDRYPLRAKKARDYAIWREAVLLWMGMSRGGGTRNDWSAIETRRLQLIDGRAYEAAPPRPGPELPPTLWED